MSDYEISDYEIIDGVHNVSVTVSVTQNGFNAYDDELVYDDELFLDEGDDNDEDDYEPYELSVPEDFKLSPTWNALVE